MAANPLKRFVLWGGLTRAVFCSCPMLGGPAGDYEHHRRQCRIARWAAEEDRALLDPQTNWVTVK